MPVEVKELIRFDRILSISAVLAGVFVWYVSTQSAANAQGVMATHNQDGVAHPQYLVDTATTKSEMSNISARMGDLEVRSTKIEDKLDDMRKEQGDFYREMLNRIPAN